VEGGVSDWAASTEAAGILAELAATGNRFEALDPAFNEAVGAIAKQLATSVEISDAPNLGGEGESGEDLDLDLGGDV
jgi:hypothetical protein